MGHFLDMKCTGRNIEQINDAITTISVLSSLNTIPLNTILYFFVMVWSITIDSLSYLKTINALFIFFPVVWSIKFLFIMIIYLCSAFLKYHGSNIFTNVTFRIKHHNNQIKNIWLVYADIENLKVSQ